MADIEYPSGTGVTTYTASDLETNDPYFTGPAPVSGGFEAKYSVLKEGITNSLVLSSDVTYYVDASGGNDTTGDGSSSTPWASLSHAIDVLRSYRIPSGVTVTIQLADGTYTETASISDVFHEGTLTIQGEHVYTKSMTSVQSSSGSAGAYSIVINVDTVTNITTDDYAIIVSASGGTNPEYLLGCWAITNVDSGNSRITVTSTNEAGVPSGAVTATVAIMKARVAFTGVTGFSDVELTFDDLVIVGDGTALTNGCENLRRTLTFESLVGVVGFGNNGVRVGALGRVDATGLVCSGNATGILSWINGVVVTDSCVFSGNANYGVFGIRRGIVYCTSSQVYGNGTTDIYAISVGYIYLSSSNYDSVSPAVNTQGNEYAYIDE